MITVVKPGLFTTIQDSGRWGYQAYGMPVAGVMDRYAFRVANSLLGNEQEAAAIEMTMLGSTYCFDVDLRVSVCGADMQATLNGELIKNWSSFFVAAGSELAFHYAVSGCRSYLAVAGGIDVPRILGSSSTYTRAGIGGLEGRALKVGDVLSTNKHANFPKTGKILPGNFVPQYENEIILRVLLGPQDDLFTGDGIETLFASTYTISTNADRMGYRLEGAKIKHIGKPDIVSDALCEGAIQVPGHGMPIIMMADRQTTGGYPKIGTVIGADLTKLAQAKTGDIIRFVQCFDDEAVAALENEETRYKEIRTWYLQEMQKAVISKQFKITINGQFYDVQVDEE